MRISFTDLAYIDSKIILWHSGESMTTKGVLLQDMCLFRGYMYYFTLFTREMQCHDQNS